MLRAVDLDMLTCKPETSPKFFRSWRMLGVEIRGEVTNRRTSSANRAHLWVRWPHLTPCISGCCLIANANVSIAMAKRMGERGHPYLVPFRMGNWCEKWPFNLIWALGEEYRVSRVLMISDWIKAADTKPHSGTLLHSFVSFLYLPGVQL